MALNEACIPTLVVMCALPCLQGGLGWGASVASGKSLTLPHGFISVALSSEHCPSPPLGSSPVHFPKNILIPDFFCPGYLCSGLY